MAINPNEINIKNIVELIQSSSIKDNDLLVIGQGIYARKSTVLELYNKFGVPSILTSLNSLQFQINQLNNTVGNSVLYSPQVKTPQQKADARNNLDVYSRSETQTVVNTAIVNLGNVVNSVTSINPALVDNSDPKNPIIAEFREISDYNNDMLNKADIDGNLTIGGIWWQDQVLSDRFANYKQVFTALSNNTIEWGNIELDKHVFLVDDANSLEIKISTAVGTIWNTLNLTNVSQLNNDAGYLQANDLDGFLYDVTYNSTTHTITFYQQNEPNIVIDLPIESLIKGVQLVGDDLIFTFEDGSTVTVPLNTLLVGVVKSVNGKTPNSQGEVIINVTDIPNLSSELANKLDIRMAGLVSNLTQPEKDTIHTKLGIVNNVTQVLSLSGNTLSLSAGGGSVNLGIVNIGGLQTALDLKANVNGNNLTNIADWRTNLGVYSTTQVDGFLANKANTNHTHSYLTNWVDTRNTPTIPNDYDGRFEAKGIKDQSLYGLLGGGYANVFGYRGWNDNSGGNAIEFVIPYNGNDLYFRTGDTTSWDNLHKFWHNGNFDPNSKANTSGYYSGLSVGFSDNSGMWNGQRYDQGNISSIDLFMTNNSSGWGYSTVPQVQSALGITTALNLNLQQVVDNGNTSNKALIIQGTTYAAGLILSSSNFEFYTPSFGAQKVLTGGLLASDTYGDASLIPANGGYFKGTIATESHGTSADWNAKVSQSQLGNYVNKAGDIMSGSLTLQPNIALNLGSASTWGIKYDTLYSGINFVRWGFTDGVVFIGDNERIGIGTTSPQAKLDVNGNIITNNATAPNHAVNLGQLSAYFQFPSGGNSGQYLNGLGQLVNFPTIPPQLVYTGSNGINVTGTVISPTYGTTAGTIAQGNDARFHNAVTLGTANGLSLSGQVLSLGLASTSANGALSSTDWNIFNNKVSANNGQLSFTAPTGLDISGTFNANQSANATIPITWQAGYQGFTTAESNKLSALQDIVINGNVYSLQNNPNINVTATIPPRTVENITASGGGNIPLTARKTRIIFTDSLSYDIKKGVEEGDELYLGSLSSLTTDMPISMEWIDKDQNLLTTLTYDHRVPRYFWWSSNDNAWLDVTT